MVTRFEPIAGKTAEIIETLMASEDMPISDSLQFKLRLCIEEVVENIVSYAYDGGNGWVEVGGATLLGAIVGGIIGAIAS